MRMTAATRLNLSLQSGARLLILTALLVLGGVVLQRHPHQWDLTASGQNTLSQHSLKTIEQMQGAITATAYVQKGGDTRAALVDLLDLYTLAKPDFTVRFVDPDLDPGSARRDDVMTDGTLVLRHDSRREAVTDLTEESITNALMRLAQKGSRKVVFLTGHGEHAIDNDKREGLSRVAERLRQEGYTLESLNLASSAALPQDTNLVVLAGGTAPLFPVEVERLTTWLKGEHARLMLLTDPGQTSGLESWLGEQGIKRQEGLVIDLNARLAGGSPTTPLITDLEANHPITRSITTMAFLVEAHGLTVETGASTPGRTLTPLLGGAGSGWLETDPVDSGEVSPDAHDPRGPIIMGAAAESGAQRLVTIADGDFATNAYVQVPGNMELFINSIRWLADNEAFIAIPPRAIADNSLEIPHGTWPLLFWTGVLGVPLVLAGSGLAVGLRRKRR
ncbi:MAG: GldG family protein [Magnetococcus sp. WYHC-3]